MIDNAILRSLAKGMPQDSDGIDVFLSELLHLTEDLKCCNGNNWISKEYEGYQVDDLVPDYRCIDISCVDVTSDFTSQPSQFPGMPPFHQKRGTWDEEAKSKYLNLLDGSGGLAYKNQRILLLQPLAYYANLICSGTASINIMSHGILRGDRLVLRQVEISCDASIVFQMFRSVRNMANNLITGIKKANPDIEKIMGNSSSTQIINNGGVINTGDRAIVLTRDSSFNEHTMNSVKQSEINGKNTSEGYGSKLFWIFVAAIVTGVVGAAIKFCFGQ